MLDAMVGQQGAKRMPDAASSDRRAGVTNRHHPLGVNSPSIRTHPARLPVG